MMLYVSPKSHIPFKLPRYSQKQLVIFHPVKQQTKALLNTILITSLKWHNEDARYRVTFTPINMAVQNGQ